MKTYSSGDDNAGDDGDKGGVGDPGLPLTSDKVGEESGEKRRGGADGLVEGDREVAKGNVAADDGGAEDDAEGGDTEELGAGLDVLEIDELEENNGDPRPSPGLGLHQHQHPRPSAGGQSGAELC
nr:hypothetical protein B296_00027044 [Ipomoea batatas]